MIDLDINELMKNDDFMDAFMKKIADEVIKRLKNKPKTALVCFSGAAIGFKQAMDSLVKLRNDGWILKVYMSDAAIHVLNDEYIKKTLGVDKIHCTATHTPQRELYEQVDEVIIATTTVNTAAKMACAIGDTEMLTLINHGLMAGKPFVCAVDGACPDNETRAKLGMGNSPAAYRDRLRDNLKALKSYGMNLVAAEDMYDFCVGTPAGKPASAGSCEVTAAPEPEKPAVQEEKPAPVAPEEPAATNDDLVNKRIISRVDIIKHKNDGVVKVSGSAIITAYAEEAAREFDIRIERV